jgi:sugar transferase (PEP-CTERM/EpsH1 system associated)
VKLLAITPRFPYPLEKGDKLRAYHQLRALSDEHQIVLVALTEGPVPAEDLAQLQAFCTSVHVLERSRLTMGLSLARAALSGEPLQVGWFRSRRAEAAVRRIVAAERPDHVYCQLLRTAPYAAGLGVPTTLDYQDAFSAAARRHADTAAWWLRPVLTEEARRVARHERRVAEQFDHLVIISEQDRDLLGLADPDRVDVLPNGVDTEFFAAREPSGSVHDLTFVGNMGYAPNVDAAGVLVERILPLVQARRPGASVLLAGARPAKAVQRLAGPQVEVSGWVDDIRDGYARGRVMVAPLQIGAGQQNKVLEAMSMGVPVVTTELVNSAIGAQVGEQIHVASDPQEFADRALELLEDPELHQRMAAAGRAFVAERYSWSAVGEQLAAIFAS